MNKKRKVNRIKRKYLLLCKEMWEWMRDNPWVFFKRLYFYKHDIDFDDMPYAECHACEADTLIRRTYSHTNSRCNFCPLTGYAWKDHCMYDDKSIYLRWYDTYSDIERQEAAALMVKACEAALADLPNY